MSAIAVRPIVDECCWTTFAQHNVLWLWVPPFAGTTMQRHAFAFPRRDAPEVFKSFDPPRIEGAGKAGCPMHPQPRVVCSKHAR